MLCTLSLISCCIMHWHYYKLIVKSHPAASESNRQIAKTHDQRNLISEIKREPAHRFIVSRVIQAGIGESDLSNVTEIARWKKSRDPLELVVRSSLRDRSRVHIKGLGEFKLPLCCPTLHVWLPATSISCYSWTNVEDASHRRVWDARPVDDGLLMTIMPRFSDACYLLHYADHSRGQTWKIHRCVSARLAESSRVVQRQITFGFHQTCV